MLWQLVFGNGRKKETDRDREGVRAGRQRVRQAVMLCGLLSHQNDGQLSNGRTHICTAAAISTFRTLI